MSFEREEGMINTKKKARAGRDAYCCGEPLDGHLPILNLAVATGPSVLPSYSGMIVMMYSVSGCSLDKV